MGRPLPGYRIVLLDADGKVMVRRSGQVEIEELNSIIGTALGLSS
jgi:hypothetical protein